MLIPATIYLLASMTSNLDIGLRHILPVYAFLAVLAAAAAWKLAGRNRTWASIVGGLMLIHAVSSLRAFPNYLAYSNEIWGGPTRTYRVLTDSNVDWGQGLPAVKRYVETHAASPCWLAYFGTVDPAHYEIPCTLLPVTSAVIWERPLGEIPPVIEGTVLVSATEMSGQVWGPGELNPTSSSATCVLWIAWQDRFWFTRGDFRCHSPPRSAASEGGSAGEQRATRRRHRRGAICGVARSTVR